MKCLGCSGRGGHAEWSGGVESGVGTEKADSAFGASHEYHHELAETQIVQNLGKIS